MRTEEQKQEIIKLYYKAIETMKANPRWPNTKTIPLAEGTINNHKVKVWLKNEGNEIRLWLFLDNNSLMKNKYWDYKLGLLFPTEGWKIIATEKTYLDWNFTVRKEFGL